MFWLLGLNFFLQKSISDFIWKFISILKPDLKDTWWAMRLLHEEALQ